MGGRPNGRRGDPRPVLWIAAAAATIALATSAPALRLDLAVSAWIQGRSPIALHQVARALDLAARTVLTVIVVGVVAHEPRRWRDAGVLAAHVASGALFGELLKTAFERLRPSALPAMTTGNSLPSGHVMTTTLTAVAAWHLAGHLPRGWRRAARTAAVLTVAAQSIARVLHGSHWPSDLVPSIVLAIGWMSLAACWRAAERHRLAIAALGAAAYGFFLVVPSARLALPSAMNRPRMAVAFWDAASALVPTGAAAPTAAPDSVTLRSPVPPDGVELVMTAHCAATSATCRSLRLSVNGGRGVDLALHCGWHWYSVRTPAVALRRGVNRVALHAMPGCPAPAVALQSIALVIDRQPPAGGPAGRS